VVIDFSPASFGNVAVPDTRSLHTLLNVASMLPYRLMLWTLMISAIMPGWHDETAEQVNEQSKMSCSNAHEV